MDSKNSLSLLVEVLSNAVAIFEPLKVEIFTANSNYILKCKDHLIHKLANLQSELTKASYVLNNLPDFYWLYV